MLTVHGVLALAVHSPVVDLELERRERRTVGVVGRVIPEPAQRATNQVDGLRHFIAIDRHVVQRQPAHSRQFGDLQAREPAAVAAPEVEVGGPEVVVPVLSLGHRAVRGRGADRRRHGPRRHAGQRLRFVGVVGEGHPHLDRRAQIVRHQRVSARRRRTNVRLGAVDGHPDPLVRVADAGQPVAVGDRGGARRQRLPDPRPAGDRRRARRSRVHLRETAQPELDAPTADRFDRPPGKRIRILIEGCATQSAADLVPTSFVSNPVLGFREQEHTQTVPRDDL